MKMKKVQNTRPLPLDDFKITVLNDKTDELEDLSALHSTLCKQTFHGICYEKIELETENDVEISLNMLENLLRSLNWLLSLRYEQFWCQVVNDKFIHSCLDSYLRQAPRYHQTTWPDELQEIHSHVHRAIFMVFLRMSTLKESDENFMTKNLFSKLIYENFLFDIPRLMDLCSLYGLPENIPLLQKMLGNIFHSQPKFYDDLKQAAKTVSEVLLQIEEKCLGTSENVKFPNKISDGHLNLPLHKMTVEELADVIFYISDTTRTLKCFVTDVFHEAGQAFFKHNLIERLVTVYCDVLPVVRDILRERERTLGGAVYLELRGHVRQSRDCIMHVVNAIIQHLTYLPAMEATKLKNVEESDDYAEKYFQILSSFLSHHQFFDDFCKKFNTRQDVQNLSKMCPDVGDAHSQFLFNTLPQSQNDHEAPLTAPVESGDTNFDQPGTSKTPPRPNGDATSDSQLAPLVTTIRDVLPDLDIGFVKKCLVYYELNPEKVIQAILEQNLPPHLAEASDQSGVTEPNDQSKPVEDHSDQLPSSSKSNDFLHERKNIFDNDEFDVFAKDSKIDKSKIHYGKKDKGKISHWTTDAEEDVEKLRLLYNRYGLGAEDTDNDLLLLRANPVSNYDDEYDDTYDDVAVGANDADSLDELGDETSNEEVNDKDQISKQSYRNRHFIQNPEILREKEEERQKRREEYFSQRGGKTKRQSRVPQGLKNVPASTDAKEDKTGDRKKREFKQSRGHNRKTLATKKASRGMFMTS